MSDSSARSSTAPRPYRMQARARQAAATRERIIDAARSLLLEGALHNATIDGLAARAGVGRATVYRVIGDKRAVVAALTWSELARAQLSKIDEAHALADPRQAVQEVLRENCRMFSELGDGLPLALELARHDPDVAAVVNATYHGRRHQSMDALALRLVDDGLARVGWAAPAIADALIGLTSFDVFEMLTARRGHTPATAAAHLIALAAAFIADDEEATSTR